MLENGLTGYETWDMGRQSLMPCLAQDYGGQNEDDSLEDEDEEESRVPG